MMKILALVVFCFVVGTSVSADAKNYTKRQIKLSHQLGEIIALQNGCGISIHEKIEEVLKQEGLTLDDMTSGDEFRRGIADYAGIITVRAYKVKIENNLDDTGYRQWMCNELEKSYGPSGITHAGMAPANLAPPNKIGNSSVQDKVLTDDLPVATTQNSPKKYNERQLTLARQIGAVMELVDYCDEENGVIGAVLGATVELSKEGLEFDTIKEPIFKAEITKQVLAIRDIRDTMKKNGSTNADVKAWACKQIYESYGPNGVIRPGLAHIKP